MKRIFNYYFVLLILITLINGCEKDSSLDNIKQQEGASYSKKVQVYDEMMKNSITLEVSSNSSDSLEAYLSQVDFCLKSDIEKFDRINISEGKSENDFIYPTNFEPSVEIQLVQNNISTSDKPFFIKISLRNLKSSPFWPIPIAAWSTDSDFLGIKNTGTVDLGARFNVKEHWYNSYEDVSSPNIRVLSPTQKYYCYWAGSYRLRVSIYCRRNVSTGIFEEPVYFIAYNQSIYDQL